MNTCIAFLYATTHNVIINYETSMQRKMAYGFLNILKQIESLLQSSVHLYHVLYTFHIQKQAAILLYTVTSFLKLEAIHSDIISMHIIVTYVFLLL